MMNLGPNVKRLVILKMSRDAIPDGGGLADGIEFFTNSEKRKAIMDGAVVWGKLAIQAVHEASEPNPWKNADDETIAGELVRRSKERFIYYGEL